jgi:hypothetical protein
MRATALLHHLPRSVDAGEQPRRRSARRGRTGVASVRKQLHLAIAERPAAQPTPVQAHAAAATVHDTMVARVRSAGGPIDNASYTCACGYVFAASVSTTVACPHCGAEQAW